MTTRVCTLALLGVLAASSSALASQYPNTVVGRWTGTSNQSAVVISIGAQSGTGSCRQITGTMANSNGSGASDINGFYCPASGRISFLRTTHSTGVTFQAYSGNLSFKTDTQHMAGTFAQEATSAELGEYPFFADK